MSAGTVLLLIAAAWLISVIYQAHRIGQLRDDMRRRDRLAADRIRRADTLDIFGEDR